MKSMEALNCDFCGGGLIIDDSREFAKCEFCGTKYMASTLRAKIQEIKGTVKVEGAVETTTGNAEKERQIKNAEAYLNLNENTKAFEIYEQIQQQFPNDYRGWFGLFTTTIIDLFKKRPMSIYYDTDGKKKITKWFQNAYSVCPNKTHLFKFFDFIIGNYGNTIQTTPLTSSYHLKIYDENLCKIDSKTINDFTAWLIFFAEDIISLLNYNRFTFFINNLKKQYLDLLNSGKLCPYIFSIFSGSSYHYEMPTLSEFSNEYFEFPEYNNQNIAQQFFRYLGYSIEMMNGLIVLHYKKNHTPNFRPISILSKWIFAQGDGYSEEYYLIKKATVICRQEVYRSQNCCQHCGGEFKGVFSKVCSECGKPKDY